MANQQVCRRLLQRRLAVVAVAVSATALTGCGGMQSLSSTRTVSVPSSSTADATASQAASSASTTAAAGTRCGVGSLAVRQASEHGAAGSMHLVFSFTNRGQTTCSLYGYPGLGLLDSSGHAMPTTVLRHTSPVVPPVPERRVELRPGKRVWFYAGFSNVSTSPCVAAARLEVTPPNAYGHLTIPTTIAPCAGVLNVSPVFAGRPIF